MGVLAFAAAGALAFMITAGVRRYALRHRLLDFPNDRSLHASPVPRGGGLAIVVTFTAGTLLLALAGIVRWPVAAALAGGGCIVALAGWLDDLRGGIPALTRLLAQGAAASWALYWLDGLDRLQLGFFNARLGGFDGMLALLGIVWCINLFNFMDGIDGIAAAETVTVAGFGALLLLGAGDTPNAMLAFVLAGSAAGFLFWNWQPARIFMGDVGSGFLGFVFAVLMLASASDGAMPLLAWLIMGGVFVLDATATLLRRIARRERFYAAHRQHAYQRLVARGWKHWQVTLAVLGVNVLLAGLAWLTIAKPEASPIAAAVAAALLFLAYLAVEQASPYQGAARNA